MQKKIPVWLVTALVAAALLVGGRPSQVEDLGVGVVVVMEMPLRELVIEDPGLATAPPGKTTRAQVSCLENGERVNTCSPYWESDNPSAVSVDKNTGVIRFNAPGGATISVYWSEEERETVLYGHFETLTTQPQARPLSPGAKIL